MNAPSSRRARAVPTSPAQHALAAALATLLAVVLVLVAGCGPTAEEGGGAAEATTATPAVGTASRGTASPKTVARDVLLVTIDTLRADVLGHAGGPRGISPHLDRLAAAGRTYPRAYAHAVLTLPSHASILTGLYPHQHGVRDNSGYRLGGVDTLAGRLAAEGFATAAFVAAFPLDARFGLDRGFEVYDDRYPDRGEADVFGLAERPGGEVVAAATAWWRENGERRRFLWVHLFEPHHPYQPAPRHAGRFPHPYLGEVATTDDLLAPLLDLVQVAPGGSARPDPSALVVVTSDHGEALGDHGEMTHGLFAYDSTLRVPLIVHGPGFGGTGVEPAVDRRLARHVDLVPTVLDAVGAAPAPELPGRSLLAPAAGGETSYFEALHAALNLGWAPLRGVIDGDAGLKYVELPLPELYDLGNDPGERRNLLATRRRDAGRLDAALPAEAPWPPAKGAVAGGTADALAGLGYLAGAAAPRRTYTAEDDPKRLVELDRRMHRMHRHFAAGELAAAERDARAVLAQRGDMEAAWSFLAQVLLQRGRTADALAVMEEAQRRGAASPALLRQRGLALVWLGRAGEAVELLTPLVSGGSDGGASAGDPAALNALGVALVEAGRAGEAVAVLERVFHRDPGDARAHETLSMAHLALGRWSEAEAAARSALAADPGRVHAWNNLGVALYRRGDGAGALDAWRHAVEIEPSAYDTLYNLGVKAAELGRPGLARAALERFVREAPPARYGADLDYARALLGRLGPETLSSETLSSETLSSEALSSEAPGGQGEAAAREGGR